MADNKPTYDDVFMAILAMDAYHVGTKAVISDPLPGQDVAGYIHNLTGVKEDEGIGTATRGTSRAHNEYGFFVASYNWNGKTVIAYRGTDQGFASGPDFSHGYGIAFGNPTGGQATEAVKFYAEIAGKAPGNGSVIVTGQSLGGGIAGLIARLYGVDAFLYNNMNFELAARNAYSDSVGYNVVSNPETGETYFYQDTALRERVYGDREPWQPTTGDAGIRAWSMLGEALSYSRTGPFGRPSYETPLDPLGALRIPGNPTYLGTPGSVVAPFIPEGLEEAGERHTSAPLIIRMFGELGNDVGGPKSTDWKEVMQDVWYGLYTVDVARAPITVSPCTPASVV